MRRTHVKEERVNKIQTHKKINLSEIGVFTLRL